MTRLGAFLFSILVMSGMVSAVPVGASVPGLGFTDTGCEGHSDSVARLYTAGLGRKPEQGGFEFWMGQYTSGDMGLLAMSNFFVAGPEFDQKYGSLNQLGFINQIYLNVLGRVGEDEGVTYWNGLMTKGLTRGELLLAFAESPENITRSGTAQPVLGPFNPGLARPWDCSIEVDVNDPEGPTVTQPVVTQPVVTQPVVTQPVVTQPVVTQPVVTQPVVTQPVPGNPGNTKNCSDFNTHRAAQEWFDTYFPYYGDVARLDGDNDGIACESLP